MSDPVEIAADAVRKGMYPHLSAETHAVKVLAALRAAGWRIVKTRQAEPRALLGDGLIVIIEEWIGDE